MKIQQVPRKISTVCIPGWRADSVRPAVGPEYHHPTELRTAEPAALIRLLDQEGASLPDALSAACQILLERYRGLDCAEEASTLRFREVLHRGGLGETTSDSRVLVAVVLLDPDAQIDSEADLTLFITETSPELKGQ